jgi:glycosyltransferase involved in cell wall biosynthesis
VNILYVGTLPPHPGGSAIVAYQLLDGLARRGHRIDAIAPATPEAIAAGDPFAASHPEIRVNRFLIPFFENSPDLPAAHDYRTAEAEAIRAAWHRTLAETRPAIVIVGRETFAWHVPDLARAAALPTLLIVHGSTLFGITNNFSTAERDRLLEQLRKADRIVAVAPHLAQQLRSLGFEDVITIPNAVDLAKFSPRPKDPTLLGRLGIAAGQPIVAHASNLKVLKRPMDIVDAARVVLRHRPDTVFVVVGDGPCREGMEQACAHEPLSGRFRFVGWVEHDLVPDYINLADMIVMPSESEACALIYVETQACERTLIASDIEAARYVIDDGQSGMLFRKGDVADLAAKIISAIDDAGVRAAIGKKARQSAMNYDLGRFVTAYETAMGELAAQSAMDQMFHSPR